MSNKEIKILVATHKKYRMPNSDIYVPIQVGKEGKEDLGYIGDDTGDNISAKNENYCELTGLYWAWKNLEADYIGLCHYRRYFTNNRQKNIALNKDNKFDLILNKSNINLLMSNCDVVLPKKRNYYIETVWSHYKNAHHIKDLEVTKEIIEEFFPEFIVDFDKIINGSKLHLYNMFLMKKEQFNEYCEWLFTILFELERRIDISNYDDYQKRIFGFVSERLFNVWLEHKKLRKVELSILNIEKVDWKLKISNFIKRKVKG